MLVQFGMGENIGENIICQTCSINPKKIFDQNVGKMVRLMQHYKTSKTQHYKTLQTSGAKIFASNISQHVGKVCPLFNTIKKVFAVDENIHLLLNKS